MDIVRVCFAGLLVIFLSSCSQPESSEQATENPTGIVEISSPAPQSVFESDEIVNVTVETRNLSGIQHIELWVNQELVQTDGAAPWSFSLTSLAAGEHEIRATAQLSDSTEITSTPVLITVRTASFVNITAPATGAGYDLGDTVSVSVDALDADGLQRLELLVNGELRLSDSSAPFEFEINDLPAGIHRLVARSVDTLDNDLSSASVDITVSPADPPDPYVRITSPASGTQIYEGDTLVIIADAFDPDGIDAARLWVNGSYYDVDSTEPYTFSLSSLSAGTHRLMVRTRDNLNNALDSDPVSIEVEAAPSVSFASPANEASFEISETIRVTANAYDPDGLDSVQLWIDGALYQTDNSAPYVFDISGLAPGAYTLQLRSIDTLNNDLRSSEIRIHVDPQGGDPEAIQLPVEVFGPSNTQQTIRFNLPDAANAFHLYIQCNACGYHNIDLDKDPALTKATVTVNNGAEIPLKHFIEDGQVYGNDQISLLDGSVHYGGIGGGFRTVKMMVPVSTLQQGENSVTFTHRDAVPPSIGFRIVDFNVLANGDINQPLLSAAQVQLDDPSLWTPPIDSATAIEEGRQLWNARNILYDPWVDSLDGQPNKFGPMTGDIKAACASCHAADGRDLKYFNFSNHAIVERSRFHGLTEEQGNKIASYIRQLDIPVTARARPWNPTYQPGPGMDDVPVYEWAAGAGMDAVLKDDEDIAPYLFPNGTSLNEVRNVVDRYATLNFRELPVNIPMPEWNQWLPIIHPDDAFDITDPAVTSDQFGNDVGQAYYNELYEIALNNPTPTNIGRITIFIKRWLGKGLTCQTNGVGSGEPLRGLNGAVLSAVIIDLNTSDPTDVTQANCDQRRDTAGMLIYEIAKRGLTAWSSVKLWEIAHGLELEEESQRMNSPVCSGGRCVDASEIRGWEIDGRNVFDRPPHFVGTASGRRFFTQNQMLGILESNSWYHLNMVLNPGYRQSMPSHFAYTYSHVQLLQFESGVDQGFRYWATLIKQRQLQTNGNYGVENGLNLRTAEPYVYYGSARNTTNTDTHSNVGQPLWGHLATAMIEDLVADASNAAPSDWANASGNYTVQDRNSTDFSPCAATCQFDIGPYQGRNTYRVIPGLREIGVEESAITLLIDWAEETWPNGPWDDVR